MEGGRAAGFAVVHAAACHFYDAHARRIAFERIAVRIHGRDGKGLRRDFVSYANGVCHPCGVVVGGSIERRRAVDRRDVSVDHSERHVEIGQIVEKNQVGAFSRR